jgi:hypothetical protein
MTERNPLLASIVATTADYREGDLAAPTPEHVDRWARQFGEGVQLPILREMDHVLKRTYFSRKRTKDFLADLLQTKKLVSDDPCAFWRGVKFHDIQRGGASQKEMLALFSDLLSKMCGFGVSECGDDSHTFVYLDDGSFTGNRIRQDLEAWIAGGAPAQATVHIITIALHSGGQYYANRRIREAARNAGKTIHFQWWRAIELEDRKTYTDSSDVLRPVAIPNDAAVQGYVASMRHQPHLRSAGQVGGKRIFSSDAGRQLLEQEFLKVGVRIRQLCPNLGDTQRPLGHMTLETLGFGSLIVTFRNCPNNAPLVLWAGDPWYPLFPRTTNSETSLKRFIAMLAKEVS